MLLIFYCYIVGQVLPIFPYHKNSPLDFSNVRFDNYMYIIR